jgi:hypothetical protein
MTEEPKKLTEEEFVIRAITNLRDEKRSKGIHTRYSGFNQAFKDYFGVESRATTDKMVADGKIEIKPSSGGVMLYLKGEGPVTKDALKSILG